MNEVKLNLLAMAREDLMGKFQLALETIRSGVNQNNIDTMLDLQLTYINQEYPSVEAIAARADEMLAYVEGRNISQ
jgi:hypothetical protein